MTDTNDVTISTLNPAERISFSQGEADTIAVFHIEEDALHAWLVYEDPNRSLTDARILKVEATSNLDITELELKFDWESEAPPTFTPSPATPKIVFDFSEDSVIARVPIPSIADTWRIWDTIGGAIPGFNLAIRVKRKG